MMRILITGGAGSIGSELALRALSDGHQVTVFDLPSADYSMFEGRDGVKIVKGDITKEEDVKEAVAGVDAVIHLAALMPHLCTDRQKTMLVNVEGTKNLLKAAAKTGKDVHFIFSSSVSVYGDTQNEEPPVRCDHPRKALDLYAESKIAAEDAIMDSGLPYTILRISGVVIPIPMEPPDCWQFMAEQRVEFVNRADVAEALYNSLTATGAKNKVFNIAGGPSWQMRGRDYAEKVLEIMELPPDVADYMQTPGWFDWYDTVEAQQVLNFQKTSFESFCEQLAQAVKEWFGE
ncbi:MAG TPA: hypothetical protein DCE07_04315 [Peptococcaceae bacterium]|nr:hypothetical protein [Peptococcaceae bacterium]